MSVQATGQHSSGDLITPRYVAPRYGNEQCTLPRPVGRWRLKLDPNGTSHQDAVRERGARVLNVSEPALPKLDRTCSNMSGPHSDSDDEGDEGEEAEGGGEGSDGWDLVDMETEGEEGYEVLLATINGVLLVRPGSTVHGTLEVSGAVMRHIPCDPEEDHLARAEMLTVGDTTMREWVLTELDIPKMLRRRYLLRDTALEVAHVGHAQVRGEGSIHIWPTGIH